MCQATSLARHSVEPPDVTRSSTRRLGTSARTRCPFRLLDAAAHARLARPRAHRLGRRATPRSHALGEALAEVDRVRSTRARALRRAAGDARRTSARSTAAGAERASLDTTFDHLPTRERTAIGAGGQFVDFGDSSDEFARLFQIPSFGEAGWLSVRGLRFDGHLTRASRAVRDAKTVRRQNRRAVSSGDRAVRARLSPVSRARRARRSGAHPRGRHAARSRRVRGAGSASWRAACSTRAARPLTPTRDSARVVSLERELARATEDARRALKRAEMVDATVASAVEQLEKAHVELHRRSEAAASEDAHDLSDRSAS